MVAQYIYMDGVVREVNERVLGRGVELVGREGGSFMEGESVAVCG